MHEVKSKHPILWPALPFLQQGHPANLSPLWAHSSSNVSIFWHPSLLTYFPLYITYIPLSIRVIILSVVVTWGNPYLLSALPFSLSRSLKNGVLLSVVASLCWLHLKFLATNVSHQAAWGSIVLFPSLVCRLIFWDDLFLTYTVSSNFPHLFPSILASTPCWGFCVLLYLKKRKRRHENCFHF